MRIYVSASGDCPGAAQKFIEQIRSFGVEVCFQKTEELTGSDGLFVCVSGTENGDVKAELNMALERKLPVAYVMEEQGNADAGLLFQLGLAEKITAGSREELERWLESVSEKAGKAKKEGKRKKFGILAVSVIACLLIAVLILRPAGNFASVNPTEAQNGAAENMAVGDREEQSVAEAVQKYLGEDPASVTVLDLSGKGLSDIGFLSDAVNLEELDLSNNEISDINALITLKKLKKLNISGNPIEDDTILDYMNGVEVIR